VVRIVADQARGRVPILAGAAEANVNETLAACEAYQQMGVRAVAIVAPFYYKLSPESVFAYFKEIATNSPIDLTLYNAPLWASPIDVPTIRRLAEFPRVIGIKDSSGDVTFMGRMIHAIRRQRPDFSFLTGWEAALVPMLIMGADGGTNATSGIVPELTRRLYDLTMSKQLDEAVKLQLRLIELFDALVYSADFPAGFRAAVELRGFRFGPGRQPLSEAQKIDRVALQRVQQCILADFGVIDPPAEGCSPRSGDLARDKVQQVTQAVVATLKQRGMI
jgi:4-hydroxy-tetrahydrodipicolinate synthase